MKTTRNPTSAEIDKLTAFLTILYAPGFAPVKQWHGGKGVDGHLQLPYPEYEAVVEAFYREIASECWLDYNYHPDEAWKSLKDDDLVRSSSIEQVKAMLTYCVRGERFCDGHWEVMITGGFIRKLLERLMVLRQGIDGEER